MGTRNVISTSFGQGKFQVTLQAFTTDNHGICAFLTGGELPHTGGVVLANPYLKDDGSYSADMWINTVPGHKDTEIGTKIAKYLAITTKQTVSLTCGIHIDHASMEEIQQIFDNCMHVAKKWVEDLTIRKSSKI